MRGLPPLQALVLLIVLAVLGYAGSRYIRMDENAPEPTTQPASNSDHHDDHGCPPVETEIELTFSSPPASYTLKTPSTNGGDDLLLLQSPATIENPAYHTVTLTAHEKSAYWLDVTWPEDAPENTHHFVRISLSPSMGENQQYTFYSDSKQLNETFDYSTGEHDHDHE